MWAGNLCRREHDVAELFVQTLRQSSGEAWTDADTMYVDCLLSGSCCSYTVIPFTWRKVVESSQFRF